VSGTFSSGAALREAPFQGSLPSRVAIDCPETANLGTSSWPAWIRMILGFCSPCCEGVISRTHPPSGTDLSLGSVAAVRELVSARSPLPALSERPVVPLLCPELLKVVVGCTIIFVLLFSSATKVRRL
jgi:hypothetical protein